MIFFATVIFSVNISNLRIYQINTVESLDERRRMKASVNKSKKLFWGY